MVPLPKRALLGFCGNLWTGSDEEDELKETIAIVGSYTSPTITCWSQALNFKQLAKHLTSKPHDNLNDGHFRVSDPIGRQLPLLKVRCVHIQI